MRDDTNGTDAMLRAALEQRPAADTAPAVSQDQPARTADVRVSDESSQSLLFRAQSMQPRKSLFRR